MNGSRTLTSLLAGAGAAMVALTTCSLIAAAIKIDGPGRVNWDHLLFLVTCSGCATLFVLSLLHSDLRGLYEALSRSAESAEREAKTDPLTGGQNRRAFLGALNALYAANPSSAERCLVFIDLDHFKRVNDTLGHEAGDAVLRDVHDRICAVAGAETVYRLSGDEFALILEDTSLTVAQGLCLDIRRRVSDSYYVDERACTIGCSLGIVALDYASVASSFDAMRKADIAMYKAKQSGAGVEVFDCELLRQVTRRAALGERLRYTLTEGAGHDTFFQAIVRRDFTPVSLEALFRWADAEWGEIAPAEAISVAKEYRTLDLLSLAVVRSACQAARALPHVRMHVNLEASQLYDTQFVSCLEGILAEEQVPSERFVLEIGEADIAANGMRIETILSALAETGFTLAVDNFGSSNASLSYLAQLGVKEVKLDRSLVRHARETGSIAVIRAKVQLAKSLGLSVTCEAIGDAEDEAIALEVGTDFLQGYRYSMPRPIGDFLHTGVGLRPLGLRAAS